ncbi:MAG: hypothetical protein ACRDVM_03075 [Acidimicrobiia bacterium]
MARLETRLFRLADRLADLQRQEELVAAELEAHRHIDDDAQRDAAVSGHYIDREEAGLTAADVARFERSLAELRRLRAKLEEKRARLLAKLAEGAP